MQKSTKELKGYAIDATDGDIGKVDDFYFDDKSWTIRYLVVDTGNWLLGRKVLLSPIAVGKADFSSGRFNVTLTKKQVEESPSVDTDKPVSRQHEAYYHDYYGYPYYWNGPYLWGPMYYPGRPGADQKRIEERRAEREEAGDLHLRSAAHVPAITSRRRMAKSVMSRTLSLTRKPGRFAISWWIRVIGCRARRCLSRRGGSIG